eukprot:maker-scaffold_46-snap-gene-1.101-mRNA-1 protein AED:0.00 eAED:0.00 QI:7/1/1/1/1/1/2/1136/289
MEECKICKIYIDKDKDSVRKHKNSSFHKSNLKRRERKIDAEKRKLRGINAQIGKPFKKKKVYEHVEKKTGFELLDNNVEMTTEHNEVDYEKFNVGDEQVLGQYEVEGKVYFQGDFHEDLLRVGTFCEAFSEDDWRKARIHRIEERLKMIHSGGSFIRRVYFVFIFPEQTTEVHNIVMKEADVRETSPEDIRIEAPGPPEGEIPIEKADAIGGLQYEEAQWETVVKREEKPADSLVKLEETVDNLIEAEKQQQYKGFNIKLGGEEVSVQSTVSRRVSKPVAFKKRKKRNR